MESHDIIYYILNYSYLGIFIWFFILDQTNPIPEELVLLTIGYISHSNLVNPFWGGLSAILGLMTIDNVYFQLTLMGNKWIEKIVKKKQGQFLNKLQDKLKLHPAATLFIMSFVPKVRFLMPIIAGLNKISFKQFFIINTSASILYVSLYLSLGYTFHHSIENLIIHFERFQNSMLGVFIMIIVIIGSIFAGKWLWKNMF